MRTKLNPQIRRLAHDLRVPISHAHLGYFRHNIHVRSTAVKRAGLGVDWFVDFACLGNLRAYLLFYPPEAGFTTRIHLRCRSGRWWFASRYVYSRLQQYADGADCARFRFIGAPRRIFDADHRLCVVVWQICTTPVRDILAINAEYQRS